MKKSVVIIALAIATLTTISCGKKEDKPTATEHEGHDHSEATMHKPAYECPMDCEKGKTYDAKGKCPVCKMDLIEVTEENHEGHKHTSDEHEGHQH